MSAIEPVRDTLFDQLQTLVNETAIDYTKAKEGVKLAGTRVRNKMQEVRALALNIRKEVLQTRRDKVTASAPVAAPKTEKKSVSAPAQVQAAPVPTPVAGKKKKA